LGFALSTLSISPAKSADDVVINELRYDPSGADSGREYVELFNPTARAIDLDPSFRIERGNGAAPDQWTAFWHGDGTRLGPGEWLVIGDDPRADHTATPALQNGPDACRIVRGSAIVDVVGWGDLQFAEYYEGLPAADPSPGLLARKPDGLDRDLNSEDFVASLRESPGGQNFPDLLMIVTPAEPPFTPRLIHDAEAHAVVFSLRSEGLIAIEAGAAGIRDRVSGAEWVLSERLLPGGEREGKLPMPGRAAGVYELLLDPWLTGGHAEPARRMRYRVGAGPVIVSEIQARPGKDEPEWLEIFLEEVPNDLAGWILADEAGTRGVVAQSSGAAGRFRVLTASVGPLLRVYPALDPAVVCSVSPWPSINDGGETVVLISPDSLTSDAVSFEATGAERGQSIERVSERLSSRDPAAWAYAPTGPTPGAVNGAHADPPEEPTLSVVPHVLEHEGATISFHLGVGVGHLRLDVVDPVGNRRGTLLDRAHASGRGGIHWDGRMEGERLPPGLYYVVATLEEASGRRSIRRTALAIGWGER